MDNEWEPAIAADRQGHVYVLYPQYGGVPGCPACYSPTMILQISSDHGVSGVGAADYRDPAVVAASVAAFAQGNAQSRALHANGAGPPQYRLPTQRTAGATAPPTT